MPTAFDVLGDPTRRRILDLLRGRENAVGELVAELALAQPTVSKHLRALRGAGLVEVRPEAQQRFYRLRPEPLLELDAWLAPFRRQWEERLDRLAERLDEMATEDRP